MLFLGDFPDESRRHEGMSQRMITMDKLCLHKKRSYLVVSHRFYWRKETVRISPNAIQYRCNTFRHFFTIKKMLSTADILYFHSVLNVLPLLLFFFFIKKHTWVVLDAHGVVPEEARYNGYTLKGLLYQLAERIIFGRANRVVTVSDAMAAHFSMKHPKWNRDYLKYPIIPSHIGAADVIHEPQVSTQHVGEKTHVLYSGNLQTWQNIDLMINLIRRHRSDRVKYTIMTGEPIEMVKRLADAGIRPDGNLEVLTVQPDDLARYYRAAHYGFILRDEMLINRVACPTKLVEYLHYGIIPIVKSSEMGDFNTLGYEYILYQDFTDKLPPRKSLVNERIVAQYVALPRALDFEKIIGCER